MPPLLIKILDFLKFDIWRIHSAGLSAVQRFFINLLRILIIAVRGYDEDRCHLRASALTYLTLLSIIPVVALGFGFAKGFGFEKLLEAQIMERLHGHEEVAERIIAFSNNLLEHARGDMIAGIGLALLLWLIIVMLGNIEITLNDIWGLSRGRKFTRKFSDYLSVAVITIILFVLSSSMSAFLAGWLTPAAEEGFLKDFLSPVIVVLLRLLPFIFIWTMFTFLYSFMPNINVRFKSGLTAGITAGTIFLAVQWLYIRFQVFLSGYGVIYGSFAALPLFLIWLRISWIVTLFGAELSFAHQNVKTYEFEPDSANISYRLKKLLYLKISRMCVKNFAEGKPPFSAEQIAEEIESPIRVIRAAIDDLADSGILSEVKGDDERSVSYQPGRDINSLTVHEVIKTVENRGTDKLSAAGGLKEDKISKTLEEMESRFENSPANLKLKDM